MTNKEKELYKKEMLYSLEAYNKDLQVTCAWLSLKVRQLIEDSNYAVMAAQSLLQMMPEKKHPIQDSPTN
jgi:hypothetical protein